MAAKHYDVKTFRASGSIGYLLKMSHSLLLDSAEEAFAGHDLSFIQWLVLIRLHEGEAVTASDLCRAMRHDNGAFTRLIDQLEARGLVKRERSSTDRRIVQLSLTAAGRRHVTELMPLVVDTLNAALQDFTKTEFAQLVRLLNKLTARLRTIEQGERVQA